MLRQVADSKKCGPNRFGAEHCRILHKLIQEFSHPLTTAELLEAIWLCSPACRLFVLASNIWRIARCLVMLPDRHMDRV
jgi:hypothetical protein